MKSFVLEMFTRDAHYPPRQVRELHVPALEGRLTVLGDHQPMVCELIAGDMVVVDTAGKRETWQVGSGYLTVNRGEVTLLSASLQPAPD